MSEKDKLIRLGWIPAEARPVDGQFLAYYFEPFHRFYCGTYDAVNDSVYGAGGFTTWLPEVLAWWPLPMKEQPNE